MRCVGMGDGKRQRTAAVQDASRLRYQFFFSDARYSTRSTSSWLVIFCCRPAGTLESFDCPLTWWQLLQPTAGLENTFAPLAMLPVIFTRSPNGGRGWEF